MKDPRPVNLNLLTIRFPIPAIISILHRITGVFLYFVIPLMLYGLQQSLNSEEKYAEIQNYFTQPVGKFLLWAFLAAFLYHFVAGFRHLLMDMRIGMDLRSGRISARIVALVAFLLIALAGYYIW